MKLFISYRRSDSQDIAARLADRLLQTDGIKDVFLDVDGIEPGVDFVDRLKSAMAESDISLILIGDKWKGESAEGVRLLDADDPVRAEVRQALESADRTIPVLLNGAPMPAVEELPEDIAKIAHLNAVFLRHASFNQDLPVLVDAAFERAPELARRARKPFLSAVFRTLLGLVMGATLLFGLALANFQFTQGAPLERTLGGTAGFVLTVAGIFIASVAASFALRPRPKRGS